MKQLGVNNIITDKPLLAKEILYKETKVTFLGLFKQLLEMTEPFIKHFMERTCQIMEWMVFLLLLSHLHLLHLRKINYTMYKLAYSVITINFLCHF